ncbi:TPA: helix-turn-helix domain-containing protein [Streptococcus suis]
MQYSTHVFRNKTSDFQDIYFRYSGISQNLPGHSYGPDIRRDFLVHFVLEGEGDYLVGDRKYRVRANQGFLILPGVSTFYKSSVDKPWKYCWIAFNGRLAEGLLRKAGLIDNNRLVFDLAEMTPISQAIVDCFQYSNTGAWQDLKLNAIVLEILSRMIRSIEFSDQAMDSQMSESIQKALEIISQGYKDLQGVNDLAQRIGLNRSYLSRLFKKEVGVSVKEYINNIKLSVAAERLSTTNQQVQEIVHAVGFSSEDVFIRAFKKRFRLTPLKYRKDVLERSYKSSMSTSVDSVIETLGISE